MIGTGNATAMSGGPLICVLVCTALLLAAPSRAASVTDALPARLAAHDAAREIQRQIDTLAGRRVSVATTLADQRLADDLANARAQLEGARAQHESLRGSVADKREAQAGMRPLLEQMLDLLSASVDADLPFERAARHSAIADARRALDDAALRMTDRFDTVLDLYQSELRAGYEMRVEPRQLVIGERAQLVNVLKVGRVALYAVNDTASECHVFQRASDRWVALSHRQCLTLAAALTDPTAAQLRGLPLSVDGP